MWNREIASPAIGRRVVDDLGALLVHFGQVETCTLTREGVTTRDGLRFYDPLAVQHLLSELSHAMPHRERRKGSAKFPVKVVLNQEDTSSVMVWNHVRRIPVVFGNRHVKFAKECSSIWEYRQIKQFAKEQDAAFSTDEERLLQLHRLQAMIEEASPTMKAASVRGPAQAHGQVGRARRHGRPRQGGAVGGTCAGGWRRADGRSRALQRGRRAADQGRAPWRREVQGEAAPDAGAQEGQEGGRGAGGGCDGAAGPSASAQSARAGGARAGPGGVRDLKSEIELARKMAWVKAGPKTPTNGKDKS